LAVPSMCRQVSATMEAGPSVVACEEAGVWPWGREGGRAPLRTVECVGTDCGCPVCRCAQRT